MRFITAFLLLILLYVFFLYYSYINFFSFIDSHHLDFPKTIKYEINGGNPGAEKLKYVALGDSLTSGTGVADYKYTYPFLVAQNMAKNTAGVIVLNLGIPGAKITTYTFDEKLIADANTITIMLGTNDVFDFTSDSGFEEKYQALIKKIKVKTNAQIIVLTIPYLGSDKIVYPIYKAFWNFKINQYNKIIKNIADENLIGLIDLYKQTKKAFEDENSLYSPDQFHPSEKGYMLFGKIINESRYFQP